MSFRLSVINPNSDPAVTEYLCQVARRVLPPGSVVEGTTCSDSPPVIETALDTVLAGPAVVDAASRAADPDAFLIGCFGSPALAALRELTQAPVVGLGAAALTEAALVTTRFGVITTLERGIAALWSQLDAGGAARACAGIVSVEAAGDGPGYDPADERGLLSRLTRQGQRLRDDGADGLVLACAGFGHLRERLAAGLGMPGCDGIGTAACLAYGLHAAGLRRSKTGGYAWPADRPEAGS